ncbi:MAG: PaaI family thioesterase [Kiloniellaceae bacterium]
MTLDRDWKRPSRYFETLGLSIAARGDGRATLAYAFDAAFGNRKGDVQGGVLAGLIDIAMSEAIRSTLDDADFRGISTMTMTVNYLDVARGDLTAEGRAERVGKTAAFASAEVRDKAGKLVATGQGAFRIIR